LFFRLRFPLRFGEGVQLRRVEVNEIDAGVGENPRVPQPLEIIAKKKAVHVRALYQTRLPWARKKRCSKAIAGMRLGDFCPDFFNREPRQPREQNNQFLFSRKADAVKAGRVIRPLRIAEMEETVGEGHVGQ